ncbi:hypothetical protein Q3O98_08740 [Ralstonia pseudosolanacearum]|uniref:hypothetical protein n=1 Tax=Ralstonia pseudosolanacearum TaxID=1310165 RepID=UPI00267442F4|nr:hypothetical protein [Ralstonia pseudosolanacearum]MDO3522166.1 hypothetical protein [Ralstonia pseudosolanacearum]MDO3545710.1 hypothetical protein [Ralstonia pseudosolanacearum]MDO3551504.1 hypothetical protein [Ralstonia pseudosolanacearum]MDO3561682.1 hypothetical protein [Ralstonia pseudosolanacearum]MDO3566847.1 hypothetical protein [Ralstonia pseudosolanacearum]
MKSVTAAALLSATEHAQKNDVNGKYCKSTSQAITKNTDAGDLVYDCDQAKGILHPHFGPYKVTIQDIQYKKYLRLE